MIVRTVPLMAYLVLLAAAGTVEVPSKPTQVTVFRDAAQVMRQATATLEPGEHVLVFGRLPPTVDYRTVQVSAFGTKATLKGVQVQRRPLPRPDTSEEQAGLQQRKAAYEAVLHELKDEIARHNGHKTLLQRMATKMEQCGKEPEDISLSKWEEFIGFFARSHAAADSALRLAEAYQAGNRTALNSIEAELARLREIGERPLVTEHTANVIVVVEKSGSVDLNLSYVVGDANWHPVYDLRVGQQQKTVAVELNAVVQQQTGEDWEDVFLELSTANPSRQGVQPELSPIRLQLTSDVARQSWGYAAQEAVMMPRVQMHNMMTKRSLVHQPKQDMPQMFSTSDAEEDAGTAMGAAFAAVSTQATTVAFTAAGRHTILGGSDASPYASYTRDTKTPPLRKPEPVRVPVAHEILPAQFRYSAVPKLEARAYLKAKLTAPKAYPLLAGPASVFTDHNRFTASTMIDFVPAGEEFWVFLGADDEVRVTHKLLKRVEQDEGGFLSGKRRRVEYKYLIEVRNGKATREEIVVWDQVPVAEDKDITVEVTEKGDVPMKRNELDFVEWMLDLQPREAKKIPFTFHVEYPKDKRITGLP